MAGEKTRIVQNSVGNYIETTQQDAASPDASAVLPMDDFSAEQAALAGIAMPFRKTVRDPFMCGVGLEAVTTPIDRDLLVRKKCTSFHVVNPNPFYVRLRGSSGEGDDIGEGEGWLWPPGFVGVYSAQYPSFVSAIAVARPGFPIADASGAFLYEGTAAPIELAYGIGGA